MQKVISVVVAGSDQIKDIAIAPGVTPKRVLEEAGLGNGYVLSRKGGDALAVDADIYNLVSDKEKLYATPEDVSVGASAASPSGGSSSPQAKLVRTRRLYPEAIQKPITLTKTREFKAIKLIKTGKDIPYWQESNWIKTGNTYRGTFKTDYGSWRGVVERNYEGDYSYYIFEPPKQLLDSDHGPCFTDKGKGRFAIHFSEKPENVDSGIITIESVITDAFRNQKTSQTRRDAETEGGAGWRPNFLEILFPRLKWRR
jgi:hypothetical protein